MQAQNGEGGDDALADAVAARVDHLSPAQRRRLAAYAAQGLSAGDRRALRGELGGALGPPRRATADLLWVVVVVAFAIVLVGSFATIAASVFVGARDPATAQTVLSLFTAVVGFLAGLFAPAPSTTPPGQITSQTIAPADAEVQTEVHGHAGAGAGRAPVAGAARA